MTLERLGKGQANLADSLSGARESQEALLRLQAEQRKAIDEASQLWAESARQVSERLHDAITAASSMEKRVMAAKGLLQRASFLAFGDSLSFPDLCFHALTLFTAYLLTAPPLLNYARGTTMSKLLLLYLAERVDLPRHVSSLLGVKTGAAKEFLRSAFCALALASFVSSVCRLPPLVLNRRKIRTSSTQTPELMHCLPSK